MSSTPLPELEPDLEFDRRTERDASEEPSRKRRREDDSLYMMEIDPGDAGDRLCRHVFGLKMGRTYYVDEKCKSLSRSMPFRMKLLAEFPEAADLEHKIHEYIGDRRNNKGLGRE